MKHDKPGASSAMGLRERAEEQFRKRPAPAAAAGTGDSDLKRVVQELQIHQIELELQNGELQQAKLELEESRRSYEDLFDFAPVGYFTLEADGRIRQVNLAGARLVEVPRGQLQGTRLGIRLTGSSRPAFASFVADVLAGRATGPCYAGLLRESGEPACGRLEGVASDDGSWGRIVMTDVTEARKATQVAQEAEAALRVHREALRSVLASTADGILAVGLNRRVVHKNRRFLEIWRIPPRVAASGDDKALLESALSQLVEPEQFLAKVEALYGSDRDDQDVLAFMDGRVVDRFSSAMMLEGAVAGRVWSFRDITARRRAEEALRALRAELEQRVSERTASLEEANRELEAYSHSIAHELRTPLRAIDGHSALIARDQAGRLDDEGRRHFEQVRWNARRMGQLIDDFLVYSQAGRGDLHVTALDMAGEARGLCRGRPRPRLPPPDLVLGGSPAGDPGGRGPPGQGLGDPPLERREVLGRAGEPGDPGRGEHLERRGSL